MVYQDRLRGYELKTKKTMKFYGALDARAIQRLALEGMILPFESSALGLFGYDVCLSSKFEFPVDRYGVANIVIGNYCDLPPGESLIALSRNIFWMPAHLSAFLFYKNAYAESGLIARLLPSDGCGRLRFELFNSLAIPLRITTGGVFTHVSFVCSQNMEGIDGVR